MGTEGKMDRRLAYRISDESARRLELIAVFGIVDGRHLTKAEIIDRCIKDYFDGILESYRAVAGPDDRLLAAMEELSDRFQKHPFPDVLADSSGI